MLVQSEYSQTRYGLIPSIFPVTSLKLLKGESLPTSFALLHKKLSDIKLHRTWNTQVYVHLGFSLAKTYFRIARQKNYKGAWNRVFKAHLVWEYSLYLFSIHSLKSGRTGVIKKNFCSVLGCISILIFDNFFIFLTDICFLTHRFFLSCRWNFSNFFLLCW